jgi:hypothetical protein
MSTTPSATIVFKDENGEDRAILDFMASETMEGVTTFSWRQVNLTEEPSDVNTMVVMFSEFLEERSANSFGDIGIN